tara:strand:- start:2679 stop:3176 length:498 start_codon:yes stop_codon:yes gene_type:complete
MASLTLRGRAVNFQKDDSWNTPPQAWIDIKEYIPKKVLWEPFMLNNETSTSITTLQEMGFEVLGNSTDDFFETNKGEVIVSNPPFSIKGKILKRLYELDKPFIVIFPISTLSQIQFKKYFRDKIQIIIPKKRIQFMKGSDQLNRSCFDVIYYCYKCNLEKDIIFL